MLQGRISRWDGWEDGNTIICNQHGPVEVEPLQCELTEKRARKIEENECWPKLMAAVIRHVCIINSLGIISSVTHVTQRYKSFVF